MMNYALAVFDIAQS